MIRQTLPGDEKEIMRLVQELADYEREPDAVINTPEKLREDLFTHKHCNAIVAEREEKIIGFALYYISYSTWRGPCLYLEDLYVEPAERKGGVGTKLFLHLKELAQTNGFRRMDWQVLDWNEPAIGFYKKHKASLEEGWLNGRFYFD